MRPSLAPLNLAVGTEDSVWTRWAVTNAPALKDSKANTVREMSTNAILSPATLPAASTACSSSTITSVAVDSDTRVHTF